MKNRSNNFWVNVVASFFFIVLMVVIVLTFTNMVKMTLFLLIPMAVVSLTVCILKDNKAKKLDESRGSLEASGELAYQMESEIVTDSWERNQQNLKGDDYVLTYNSKYADMVWDRLRDEIFVRNVEKLRLVMEQQQGVN